MWLLFGQPLRWDWATFLGCGPPRRIKPGLLYLPGWHGRRRGPLVARPCSKPCRALSRSPSGSSACKTTDWPSPGQDKFNFFMKSLSMELFSRRKSRLVSAQVVTSVLMKCQNNRDNAWRTITKFIWQFGRYEPSSPISCHAPRCIHLKWLLGKNNFT